MQRPPPWTAPATPGCRPGPHQRPRHGCTGARTAAATGAGPHRCHHLAAGVSAHAFRSERKPATGGARWVEGPRAASVAERGCGTPISRTAPIPCDPIHMVLHHAIDPQIHRVADQQVSALASAAPRAASPRHDVDAQLETNTDAHRRSDRPSDRSREPRRNLRSLRRMPDVQTPW